MAFILPAQTKVSPSYTEPGLILTFTQPSGAFDLLGGGKPMVKLGEGDLMAYVHRLDLRTRTAAGQSSYNQLPTAELVGSFGGTPTYLFQSRGEYNHHDTAAASRWNFSLPEANRLAQRQGIFQSLRLALLYGMKPDNYEGLLNTYGATAATLGTDSYGSSTLTEWDNGELGLYFVSLITNLLTRTNQLGAQQRIAILAPQRVMAQLFQIVQLTSFQRSGAGTGSIQSMVNDTCAGFSVDVDWVMDDTLIGKGSGSTDAIIIAVPEVKNRNVPGINVNEFAQLQPGMNAVTAMFADKAAPTEITSPAVGGATDVLMEMRATSGIAWRGEAVTVLSAAYS